MLRTDTPSPASDSSINALIAANGGDPNAAAAGGGLTLNNLPDQVYFGSYQSAPGINPEAKRYPGEGPVVISSGTQDNLVSTFEAHYWLQQQFNDQTGDYKRIRQEMIDAGLVPHKPQLGDILRAWDTAIGWAQASTAKGAKITPEAYIALQASQNLADGGTGAATRSVERSTETAALRSTADLGGDAQQIAQQTLGRRVSGQDLDALVGAGHAVDAANPAVRRSTTTSTIDPVTGRTVSSATQSTNTGGAGASAIGEAMTQQAMASPEYGAYQAAGHIFPWLLNALAAVTGAGA